MYLWKEINRKSSTENGTDVKQPSPGMKHGLTNKTGGMKKTFIRKSHTLVLGCLGFLLNNILFGVLPMLKKSELEVLFLDNKPEV